MKLRLYIIALLVFGTVTTAFWGAAGHMASNYGVDVSENLDSLSQVTNISTTARDAESRLENPWGDGFTGIIYTTLQAGYSVVVSMLSVVDNTVTIIITVNGLVPVPGFVIDLIEAVFFTFFVFAFITYLRGGNE